MSAAVLREGVRRVEGVMVAIKRFVREGNFSILVGT